MNNREIKFRIFDKEKNHFLFTGLVGPHTFKNKIKVEGTIPLYMNIWGFYVFEDWERSIVPENYVFQQYIGLKDKNNKDIYEGDIIKYQYSISEHELEDEIGEVYFEDGMFIFDRKMQFCTSDSNFYKDDVEVIGNIFETPKLLK